MLAQYDVPAEVLGNPANAFVADFVGSDRGLKRLKVMPITPDVLEHPEGMNPATGGHPGAEPPVRIELGRSLEEALARDPPQRRRQRLRV